MVAKPSGHKNKHVLGIAARWSLNAMWKLWGVNIFTQTSFKTKPFLFSQLLSWSLLSPVVCHERKSVKCTRSLFDTVYPIPAGSSLVSGSSGRQSYRAKTYRLYSPPSPQGNVATVHWTGKRPSGFGSYTWFQKAKIPSRNSENPKALATWTGYPCSKCYYTRRL